VRRLSRCAPVSAVCCHLSGRWSGYRNLPFGRSWPEIRLGASVSSSTHYRRARRAHAASVGVARKRGQLLEAKSRRARRGGSNIVHATHQGRSRRNSTLAWRGRRVLICRPAAMPARRSVGRTEQPCVSDELSRRSSSARVPDRLAVLNTMSDCAFSVRLPHEWNSQQATPWLRLSGATSVLRDGAR
jgi:hypothetical protein